MSTALRSSPSTSFDMALGLLSSSILVAKVRMLCLSGGWEKQWCDPQQM